MLADDQAMIRHGLSYIVSTQEDLRVVGEAGNGDEAVAMAADCRPDVILMDIRMPGRTGIEATRAILKDNPDARIVLLTTFDVDEYVFDGMRAGAVGYLLKDADTHDLLDAIRAAQRGEAIYRTGAASRVLAQAIAHQASASDGRTSSALRSPAAAANEALLEPLTERELDVLQHMAYGKRNSQIAEELFVSEGTVKTHVHNILQKLRADDRTQAVVFAIRNRLVD
ncbi:MAG: response regulator [Bacilli bacterium]